MFDVGLVFGTKRSGHHAVLIWIAKQTGRQVYHVNDARIEETSKGKIVGHGGVPSRHFNKGKKNGITILNFENGDISRVDEARTPFTNKKILTVLVVRDVYNMLASSLASTFNGDADMRIRQRMKSWVQHAKEYIGETSFLPENSVIVSYNQWFVDEAYRKSICMKIDIPFTDEGLQDVPPHGGGSTFDKHAFQNKAQKMKVLSRYKKFVGDKRFNHYLGKYPEVHELNNKIFNFVVE